MLTSSSKDEKLSILKRAHDYLILKHLNKETKQKILLGVSAIAATAGAFYIRNKLKPISTSQDSVLEAKPVSSLPDQTVRRT